LGSFGKDSTGNRMPSFYLIALVIEV